MLQRPSVALAEDNLPQFTRGRQFKTSSDKFVFPIHLSEGGRFYLTTPQDELLEEYQLLTATVKNGFVHCLVKDGDGVLHETINFRAMRLHEALTMAIADPVTFVSGHRRGLSLCFNLVVDSGARITFRRPR